MNELPQHSEDTPFVDAHLEKVFNYREEAIKVANIFKGSNHRDLDVIVSEVEPVIEGFVVEARSFDVDGRKDEIRDFIDDTVDKMLLALQEYRYDARLRGIAEAQLQNYSSIGLAARS